MTQSGLCFTGWAIKGYIRLVIRYALSGLSQDRLNLYIFRLLCEGHKR
jgi:hypothetical protein